MSATPNQPPTLPAPTLQASSPQLTEGTTAPASVEATASASTPATGFTPFGEYDLLDELGRGGMGVVYKALDRGLNRVVAVKMILPGALPGPTELRRFQTEAEAAAQLSHPHIVTVHRVGVVEGRPFYSMDFVEGPSLSQRLAQGPLPGRDAARYLVAVARAVHHAHERGILHRDLKPGNILLGNDDRPRVADFGLAKQFNSQAGHTRTGAIVGTPSYMAPEQAAGRKDLGPACDVYGLGALFYELLTGRPPFQAETPLETLMQVVEREPAPPRLLNPSVDRDLETICLKCLEKEPGARYADAAAVADDLERYLNDESIQARSLNVMDRLARTLGRDYLDADFSAYSLMLQLFAGVILAEQIVMFVLLKFDASTTTLGLARLVQYPVLAIIFWQCLGRLLPQSRNERLLWSVWLGYFIACAVISAIDAQVSGLAEMLHGSLYAHQSVAAAVCFFVMGGAYWGRFYPLAVVFFALAIAMPLCREWSPLVFGSSWAVALTLIARHLRRLGVATGNSARTEVWPTAPTRPLS
jgi:serine/threonine-protein kinase